MAKTAIMYQEANLKTKRGFTLAELLVVLVIIALTSAVLMPRMFPDRSGFSAKNGAIQLANLAKLGRKTALTSGVSQRIIIDTDNKTAWLENGSKMVFAANVDLEAKTAEPESTTGLAGIRFFPDGASTGAEIRIVSPRSAYMVSVIWANSEVRLEALE